MGSTEPPAAGSAVSAAAPLAALQPRATWDGGPVPNRTYSFRAYSIRLRATVPAVARSDVTLDEAILVGIRLCAAVSAAARADVALEVASAFYQT